MRLIAALALLLLASLCTASSSSSSAASGLVNTKVDRHIDLKTQLARHTIEIRVANKGSKSASEYLLSLQDEYQASHLAFLKVETEDGHPLSVSADKKDKESHTMYKVTLTPALAAGASTTLRVTMVLTHTMSPFPTHVTQGQHQLVRYFDNHFFYSPYPTTSQKTVVKLATSFVEDHSENAPTQLRGDTITYGSYEDINPFTHSKMLVHFENNAPFITISKLVKEYEISHWGNLAVEQHFDIQHDGAALKGPFSRYDFQRNPSSSPAVVLQITEVLPFGAADVYYRDDIGNISTSAFTLSERGLELHLVPRFPLFGGWKNNFYMGFNLPLQYYLFTAASDSSHYVLNVTFGIEMTDVVIDHIVVRIILPEGAKDADVETPFSVDSESTDVHYTYLDTTGRPVLVVEKRNVVIDHNQYFQVHYTYSKLSMLQEPLLVVGAFLFFFLAIMFFVRFELSISKSALKEEEIEKSAKASAAISALSSIVERRSDLHQELDALSGSVLNTTQLLKKFDDLRTETSKLLNAAAKVEGLPDKLREVEAAEAEKLSYHLDLLKLEAEFKAGKKKKGEYNKEKEALTSNYNAAKEAINVIVEELLG